MLSLEYFDILLPTTNEIFDDNYFDTILINGEDIWCELMAGIFHFNPSFLFACLTTDNDYLHQV